MKLDRIAMLFATTLLVQPAVGWSLGLPGNWSQTVLLIETETKGPQERGHPDELTEPEYAPVTTGFPINICGRSLLFSNRHVLLAEKELPLFVRVPLRSGGFVRLPIGVP